MSSSPTTPISVRRSPPPPLRWRSWPMEEGGPVAWVLTAIMLSLSALAGWVMSSALWSLVVCSLLAAAVWRYFVPVHYEINPQGIFQEVFGRRHRISWRSIGHVELGRDGLLLAPARVCCAAFRGLYLPWGRHRAEVLASVHYHLHQFHPDEGLFDFDVDATSARASRTRS